MLFAISLTETELKNVVGKSEVEFESHRGLQSLYIVNLRVEVRNKSCTASRQCFVGYITAYSSYVPISSHNRRPVEDTETHRHCAECGELEPVN